ncbi:redoxin domain-containing protein [Thalassotalea sp. G2M2-11]|uniref:redoxin domain-containing protein n=1 Tax=Thalassotalea sp. G2M2-11 TaxID=2787627 RepID=UPI001F49B1B5|nr:redoxin domain-containing protein [Thalassotalea sp. G2M2-11]
MINVIFSVLLGVVVFVATPKVNASNLPDKLLAQKITLISGEQVTLANYLGQKPVYLKFWATWCQPCLKEMPHFEHVQQTYGDAIAVIGINIGINDDRHSVDELIKELGLTMPTAIDTNGDLAKAFHFTGTPYHLLFDKQMNLVHLGHKATESLDNKLALLAQHKTVDFLNAEQLNDNEEKLSIALNDDRVHALFFTATWCDWYLKDSRPAISQRCIDTQHGVNTLAEQYPQVVWHGLVSRLWTGEQDKKAYQKKYAIDYRVDIDKSNTWFYQYTVNELPELILIKNDKILFRAHDLSDETILKQAKSFLDMSK